MILDEAEAVELHRDQAREEIVVVAPEVDDLGVAFLHEGEDAADEARVCAGPLAVAGEAPAVDDVAVQD